MEGMTYNKAQYRYMKCFWIGIFLYGLSLLLDWGLIWLIAGRLSSSWMSLFNIFVRIPGLFLFFYGTIHLTKIKNQNSVYLWIMMMLLFLWFLFVIGRAPDFEYRTPFLLLSMFVPVVVFFPLIPLLRTFIDFTNWVNKIFFVIFIVSLPLFSVSLLAYFQYFCEVLSVGAAFMFMNNKYFSGLKRTLPLIITLITVFLVTYTARRNLMLTFGLYAVVGGFYYVFKTNRDIQRNIIVFLTAGLFCTFGYVYFMNEQSGTFSRISRRATENTREEVFANFFLDMSSSDWLIGKGLAGTYYCPGVDEDEVGDFVDDRPYIECGYLQVILKGGLVNVLLYLCIYIPAVFKGFRSKNTFSKICAVFILIYLVDMIAFGLPVFDMRYFLVWICVSVCFHPTIRFSSDNEIKQLLNG